MDQPANCQNDGLLGKISTLLIMQFEMPALQLQTQATFAVKASRQESIFDGVNDLVHSLVDHFKADFVGLDREGSSRRLDVWRKQAMAEFDEWQSRMKMVDDWKSKVNRASQQMNRMRDAYYREIFHLREQVYQKNKADQKGEQFQPTYALHFDPSEYTMENEVQKLVTEKTAAMQQELETKVSAIEFKSKARLEALTNQLQTANMILTRKQQLVEKLMVKHGYNGEAQVQEELGPVHVSEKNVLAKIQKMTDRAVKQAQESRLAASVDSRAEAKQWLAFLERKYGSLKEAKITIGLKRSIDESVGLQDFRNMHDELGYVCTNAKAAFLQLSGGAGLVPLSDLLELPQPVATAIVRKPQHRRTSAPSAFAGTKALRAIEESEDDTMRPAPALLKPFGAMASLLDEGSDSDRSQASSSSFGSECSGHSSLSTSSKISEQKPRPLKRQQSISMPGKAQVKSKPNFSRGRKCKTVEQGTMTDNIQVEQGTDAMPYEAAFPKIQKVSRAVQSKIDGRMLDKAMDFFDREAENNWNSITNCMVDSESDHEFDRMRKLPDKLGEHSQRNNRLAVSRRKDISADGWQKFHAQKGASRVQTFSNFKLDLDLPTAEFPPPSDRMQTFSDFSSLGASGLGPEASAAPRRSRSRGPRLQEHSVSIRMPLVTCSVEVQATVVFEDLAIQCDVLRFLISGDVEEPTDPAVVEIFEMVQLAKCMQDRGQQLAPCGGRDRSLRELQLLEELRNLGSSINKQVQEISSSGANARAQVFSMQVPNSFTNLLGRHGIPADRSPERSNTNEEEDEDFVLKREMSHTAKVMASVDGTRLITAKAKRQLALGQYATGDAANDQLTQLAQQRTKSEAESAEVTQLMPGWSGLMNGTNGNLAEFTDNIASAVDESHLSSFPLAPRVASGGEVVRIPRKLMPPLESEQGLVRSSAKRATVNTVSPVPQAPVVDSIHEPHAQGLNSALPPISPRPAFPSRSRRRFNTADTDFAGQNPSVKPDATDVSTRATAMQALDSSDRSPSARGNYVLSFPEDVTSALRLTTPQSSGDRSRRLLSWRAGPQVSTKIAAVAGSAFQEDRLDLEGKDSEVGASDAPGTFEAAGRLSVEKAAVKNLCLALPDDGQEVARKQARLPSMGPMKVQRPKTRS